ncbi:MAG: hypothetical protein M3Z19_02730 [Chloroflexota bacterium]|nr:hypothetical protein [Chloroflexota bacterium]
MYRIPDNISDDAFAEWLQDVVNKMDAPHTYRTSRRPLASLEWESVGALRVAYLQTCANDAAFPRHLQVLWETHHEEITSLAAAPWEIHWWHIRFQYGVLRTPPVQAYFDAVAALANGFGLDMFMTTKDYRRARGDSTDYDDSTPGGGELADFGREAIHRWCMYKALIPHCTTADFGVRMGYDGGRPEVGEIIPREEVFVSVPLDGEHHVIRLVDERRAPILDVPAGERWYADKERRSDAKKRLMAGRKRRDAHMIGAELERLQTAHEKAGYTFSNIKMMREQHLRWLCLRVAYLISCERITTSIDPDAEWEEMYSESTVRKATESLAEQIGLSIPRPPYTK